MPIEAPASAAIYCRISRDPEGEGVKVERQEAICRELAARHGLPVVEVYSDNDIGASDQTAKKKVRHDFQRMVADAKAGRFTHILAYSSSRLTRRMAELEVLVELSEAHGIRFITEKSGQYDLSTAGGLTVARILAAVDAGESKTISERQKSTYRHNALQGLPKPHKQRPFGWKKDAVTIEPEEAALIRKGVEDLIKGKSLMSIGRQWEAAGVLTAAGKAEWSWQTLNRVLVGYRTAGIRTLTERVPGKPEKREPLKDVNGEFVRGTWEAIITPEQREAALAKLETRSLTKHRKQEWLLKGVLRCAVCGGKMYGGIQKREDQSTYQCKHGHNGISAFKLESLVLSAVFTHARERAEREAEQGDAKRNIVPEEFPDADRLKEVSEMVTELMDAYNARTLPAAVVFPQVDRLEKERSELRSAQDRFLAAQVVANQQYESSEEIWADVAGGLFGLEPEDQTIAIQREIKEIVVSKGKRGRAGWGVDNLLNRLEVYWQDVEGPQRLVRPPAVTSDDLPPFPDPDA